MAKSDELKEYARKHIKTRPLKTKPTSTQIYHYLTMHTIATNYEPPPKISCLINGKELEHIRNPYITRIAIELYDNDYKWEQISKFIASFTSISEPYAKALLSGLGKIYRIEKRKRKIPSNKLDK